MKLISTLLLAGFATVAIAMSPAPGKRLGDAYTLDKCPVSGAKLTAKDGGVARIYEGREVRFCCGGCPGKFEKDLAASFKKLDEAIIKDQKRAYPMKYCVVSNEPMVEDGKDIGVDVVWNNRLVRLCCNGCKRGMAKDPAKVVKKLDEAVMKMQAKAYPLKTCAVSGEELGDEPYETVVANRLVRLCCKGCKRGLEKNPVAVVAKVDAGWKARHSAGGEHGGEHGGKGEHGKGHDAGKGEHGKRGG